MQKQAPKAEEKKLAVPTLTQSLLSPPELQPSTALATVALNHTIQDNLSEPGDSCEAISVEDKTIEDMAD